MTDIMRPTVEQFDPLSGEAIRSDFAVVTVLDALHSFKTDELVPIEPGQDVFLDMTLYDIPITVVRAMHNLKRGYPRSECWAKVFNVPSHLREIVEQTRGVHVIGNATLHPDRDNPSEKIRKTMARWSLEAGCGGVFVDFDCQAIAEDFPHRQYFRYARS